MRWIPSMRKLRLSFAKTPSGNEATPKWLGVVPTLPLYNHPLSSWPDARGRTHCVPSPGRSVRSHHHGQALHFRPKLRNHSANSIHARRCLSSRQPLRFNPTSTPASKRTRSMGLAIPLSVNDEVPVGAYEIGGGGVEGIHSNLVLTDRETEAGIRCARPDPNPASSDCGAQETVVYLKSKVYKKRPNTKFVKLDATRRRGGGRTG